MFRRAFSCAFLAAFLTAVPAQAYILPADFICRLVADSHKSSLRDVSLMLTVEAPEGTPPPEERIYLKRPERMRWVVAVPSPAVTVVREDQQALFAGQKLSSTGRAQDLLAALMLPRGKDLDETSARLMELLARAGVDTSLVTLARHADGVAYVIGAHVWEPQKPQVWIDKQSYLPVRLRIPQAAAEGVTAMRETRLLNYAAGIPRLWEVYENDQLVRRAEVTQVSINQNLPETLFDLREAPSKRP